MHFATTKATRRQIGVAWAHVSGVKTILPGWSTVQCVATKVLCPTRKGEGEGDLSSKREPAREIYWLHSANQREQRTTRNNDGVREGSAVFLTSAIGQPARFYTQAQAIWIGRCPRCDVRSRVVQVARRWHNACFIRALLHSDWACLGSINGMTFDATAVCHRPISCGKFQRL